jgi:heme A synthase
MSTEALVGAGLVLFRMVADNPSTARAAWMAAHLVNTFLLLAALAWMAASARRDAGVGFPRDRWLRRAFGAAAVALLLVGVSGAVAALGDTLFPASSFVEGLQDDLSPTSHVFLKLRLWHPVMAVLASGYLLGLSAALPRRLPGGSIRPLALTLGALVVIQVGIGLLNVALLAPVWTQLLHLLMADATWIVLVWLALSSPSSRSDATLVPS